LDKELLLLLTTAYRPREHFPKSLMAGDFRQVLRTL